MNTEKYYDTSAIDHFYDVLHRRITRGHDSMPFLDEKRMMFVEMLNILDEVYDDFFAEIESELKHFDVCGRFISDDVYGKDGNFLPEVVVEARKFAHTFPAYSEAALVYWDYIDRLTEQEDE